MSLRGGVGRQLPLAVVAILLVTATCAAAANPFRRGAPPPSQTLNIAHAGASSIAPQNTLAAARAAFDLGADVWGVDVRLTGDEVFVLMHDETLERTTDAKKRFPSRAPWCVESFTLDEIRTLDAGSWFVRDDPFGQIGTGRLGAADLEGFIGEPVPTLREALEFVAEHQWLIDIEIKPVEASDHEWLARQLLDLITEAGIEDRAMISSFDHEILRAVRQLDPSIPIGVLAIFAPQDPVTYLTELSADIYLPSLVGYTDDLLRDLSEAGIGVHVWTYNAEDQLERLARTPGVTGIYTDFPQRLERILEYLNDEADG